MTSSACKPASISSERIALTLPVLPRSRGGKARFAGREEPRLHEMIEDPIFRHLMASDGVRMDELLNVIAAAKERLA